MSGGNINPVSKQDLPKEIKQNSATGQSFGCLVTVNSINISTIQGDGGSPTNTVTVETVGINNYIVGQTISVIGTAGYDETGLTISAINTPTNFDYTTTSHTLSTLESVGSVSDIRAFDISAGAFDTIDTSDSQNIVRKLITVPEFKAIVDDFPASPKTYVTIGSTNPTATLSDIIQRDNIPPDADQRRDEAVVGQVLKFIPFNLINSATIPAYGYGETTIDTLLSLRAIKVFGLTITPNGANLLLNRAEGASISVGQATHSDSAKPHFIRDSALNPVPQGLMARSFVDLAGLAVNVVDNNVDPDNYAPDGVLIPVPDRRYTAQKILWFGNSKAINVIYGTALHVSIEEAILRHTMDKFTESEFTVNGCHIGTLIVKQGTTDLAAAFASEEATFIEAGPLREGNWRGGSDIELQVISAQITDSTDQIPPTENVINRVTLNTNDDLQGITHSTSVRTFDVIFETAGNYTIDASCQVSRTGNWQGWIRKGMNQNGAGTVTVSNPANINAVGHGLVTGQTAELENYVTTGDVNGEHLATRIDDDNFTVPVNVTSVTVGSGNFTRLLDANDDIPNSTKRVVLNNTTDTIPIIVPFSGFIEENEKVNIVQVIDDTSNQQGLYTFPAIAGSPPVSSIKITISKS